MSDAFDKETLVWAANGWRVACKRAEAERDEAKWRMSQPGHADMFLAKAEARVVALEGLLAEVREFAILPDALVDKVDAALTPGGAGETGGEG